MRGVAPRDTYITDHCPAPSTLDQLSETRTMYTIAICLVLAAGTFANMHGMNNYGHMNMGMNNMMNGWGMQQMGNNQMGQHMNMLAQILGMGNNMNNMNMNGMNGMNMMNNGGMMNNMMGMMLQALMQQMNGGNRGGHSQESESSESESDSSEGHSGISQEDIRRLEEMMKMEFATEVAKFVMVYQEYQQKMKAFETAVDGLCIGVEAAYEHAKRYNVPENKTFNAEVEALGEEIDKLDSREDQIDRLVEVIENREDYFGAGFFMVASGVCTSGEEYLKAYQKMENMDNDKSCDCHDKK